MDNLKKPLNELKGIGPAIINKLHKLNLYTIKDLLYHWPTRYEDFSKISPIKSLKTSNKATIQGKIQTIKTRRLWPKKLTITEALIKDDSGTLKAVWFNQPYLGKTLKPGQVVYLSGRLKPSRYGVQMEQPNYDLDNHNGLHTSRLLPYYPLSNGLTHHFFRKILNQAKPHLSNIKDWLPDEIKKQFQLPNQKETIKQLHWPTNLDTLKSARRRLVFEELYLIALTSRLSRLKKDAKTAPVMPFHPSIKNFVSQLPYQLTDDQRVAAWEIIKDLNRSQPMFRLLQGDVGSGKTVVAGLAALNCFLNGYQTVLLAPTEVLAVQHFNTLRTLLADFKITIGLLTQGQNRLMNESKTSKDKIKKLLAKAKINIIIGTHALLQPNLIWPKLGLIIVDEQHRFGVAQRQTLTINPKGNLSPHFLSLTATPIPRSLGLALYGDLDISLIKNLPPGRPKIITRIITPKLKPQAYQLIKKEVALGHKVFIICPLVEESEVLDAAAVTEEHSKLQKEIFPDIKLGLLHGRLNSSDKQKALLDFKNGLKPILVATSVVEVGLDISDATVIAIQNAERFGLAQLHQLRGRVGRSNLPSHCFLMTEDEKNSRLTAMVKYTSGFDLAEFDLKTRGPGNLLGTTQSGLFKLKYWELANSEIINSARQAAALTVKLDSSLQIWSELKNKINEQDVHLE